MNKNDLFWVGQFFSFWLVWFTFAKRGRWHEYLPTCILASFTSVLVESGTYFYSLWKYSSHPLVAFYLNAFGVYIVVMYLFLQWLPKKRTIANMLKYWFIWTAIVIVIERVHLLLGHMWYLKWWNSGYSYIADWFLFLIFYKYHVFITERRNGRNSIL